jgi:hypothetical protein
LKKYSKLCKTFQINLMWFLKSSFKWMEIILDIWLNSTFQMAIMYVIHTSFAKKTIFNYNTFGNVSKKLKRTQCWQGLTFQILIHIFKTPHDFQLPKWQHIEEVLLKFLLAFSMHFLFTLKECVWNLAYVLHFHHLDFNLQILHNFYLIN